MFTGMCVYVGMYVSLIYRRGRGVDAGQLGGASHVHVAQPPVPPTPRAPTHPTPTRTPAPHILTTLCSPQTTTNPTIKHLLIHPLTQNTRNPRDAVGWADPAGVTGGALFMCIHICFLCLCRGWRSYVFRRGGGRVSWSAVCFVYWYVCPRGYVCVFDISSGIYPPLHTD